MTANEINEKLDNLFSDLKLVANKLLLKLNKKFGNFGVHILYDQKLTLLLAEGSEAVNNNQLNKAINIFTKVIELDPNWAEAWNKRATVFYLIGQYKKSQSDIDKVLELEKRHFGALAGQGLVNIKLKNYEKAIKSYEKSIRNLSIYAISRVND